MTLTMMSIKTTQKNLTWLNLNTNRGRLTFDFSTQHICLIVIVVLWCGSCCVCRLLASQQQQNRTKGEQVCFFVQLWLARMLYHKRRKKAQTI